MKTDGFNITNDIQNFHEEVYDWRKGGSTTIQHLDLVKAQFIGRKYFIVELAWLWSAKIRQVKTTRNIKKFWRKMWDQIANTIVYVGNIGIL